MTPNMVDQAAVHAPHFTPERIVPALEFIEEYWTKLERYTPRDDGTLVGVPRPYFVSSATTGEGFAFQELYYWDTYFITRGFVGTSRQIMIRGMVESLMALMDRFRVIPNASRTYLTSRSQPPFLTSMIMMVYGLERDKRWLRRAMDVAKEEYRSVWMASVHPNWRQVFNGLSRYYDVNVLNDLAECESGWDMTTRFDRQCLSYIPVDLNALLYKYEKDFGEAATILGDKEEAQEWARRAAQRKRMMHEYLWDEGRGFYFDYNFMTGKRSKIWSLAGFFPMWAGMEDEDKAARIMQQLHRFEAEGGLTTTAQRPEVKSPVPTQWAYPNGWAPLHLIATDAMQRYGYTADAERIARKWLNANLVQYERHGEFYEKYNMVAIGQPPLDGVYPSQVGFAWTNAVFECMTQHYLKPEELPRRALRRTFIKPIELVWRDYQNQWRSLNARMRS